MGQTQDKQIVIPAAMWGRRIEERRRSIGLTQRQLASAAAVAQQTVSKLERGRLHPTDEVKIRMAMSLGRQVRDLFPMPEVAEFDAVPV